MEKAVEPRDRQRFAHVLDAMRDLEVPSYGSKRTAVTRICESTDQPTRPEDWPRSGGSRPPACHQHCLRARGSFRGCKLRKQRSSCLAL